MTGREEQVATGDPTPRWLYRFHNFSRAYSLLREAAVNDPALLSDLEREGLIQRFEYTFELAWKTLKDRLAYDGIQVPSVTPRSVIRQAFATGLIGDGEAWIDMLTDRNAMSHKYDADEFEAVADRVHRRYLHLLGELWERFCSRGVGRMSHPTMPGADNPLGEELLAKLTRVFSAYPELRSVTLFGSHALGSASPRSDIDLATKGIRDRYTLGRLILDLEDLDIPQRCDAKAFEEIRHAPLRQHIEAVGVTIYMRPDRRRPEMSRKHDNS